MHTKVCTAKQVTKKIIYLNLRNRLFFISQMQISEKKILFETSFGEAFCNQSIFSQVHLSLYIQVAHLIIFNNKV